MKRLFDVILALNLSLFLFPIIILIGLAIKVSSKGPIFYWSDRVGRENKVFKMPKFRSMKLEAPVIATHMLQNPGKWLTPIGGFIRRSSLDELPQLWSILKGDMSFVGPRPALFNQTELIEFRTRLGLDAILPGLTGWAQVNGRDELPIAKKVEFDYEYLQCQSLVFDLKIMGLTLLKAFRRDGVSH